MFILRYHEIGLKGENRSFFESRLKDNLQTALQSFESIKVQKKRDHFRVSCLDQDEEAVKKVLAHVFGVVHFSSVKVVEPNLDRVIAEACALLQIAVTTLQVDRRSVAPISFRIQVHRSDKRFRFTSIELAQRLAEQILPQFPEFKVDLKYPEITLFVDWRSEEVHLSAERIPGVGGLPVGTSGKVLALLSSGFDSPVASWMMMRRGAKVAFVHFHSYPATSEESIETVKSIVRVLNRYQFRSKLYLIPLIDFQKVVVAKAPAPLRVVLYRRMMLRLAHRVLYREKAKGFVTGESLGQVASQTLDNLHAVDVLAQRPMFRPLIGMDKREIIQFAERIGTAELSKTAVEDCCSLYVPRSPVLFAEVAELEAAEALLDVEGHMERLWKAREVLWIEPASGTRH